MGRPWVTFLTLISGPNTDLDILTLLRNEVRNPHPLVAGALLNQDFAAGTSIIEQGDTGHGFSTMKYGEATVRIKYKNKAAWARVTRRMLRVWVFPRFCVHRSP